MAVNIRKRSVLLSSRTSRPGLRPSADHLRSHQSVRAQRPDPGCPAAPYQGPTRGAATLHHWVQAHSARVCNVCWLSPTGQVPQGQCTPLRWLETFPGPGRDALPTIAVPTATMALNGGPRRPAHASLTAAHKLVGVQVHNAPSNGPDRHMH